MPTPQRFRCSLNNSNYTFKNGKTVPFLNGEYITDLQYEIDELNAEIDGGNQFFSQQASDKQVDTRDPMDVIRAQARQEALAQLRAEQAAAMDKSRVTESDQDFRLRVTNSDDIGAAMSGSTSLDVPVAGTASVISSTPNTATTSQALDSKTIIPEGNVDSGTAKGTGPEATIGKADTGTGTAGTMSAALAALKASKAP